MKRLALLDASVGASGEGMVVPACTDKCACCEAVMYSCAKCSSSATMLLLPLLLLCFMDSGKFALTVWTIISNAAAYSGDKSFVRVEVVVVVVVVDAVLPAAAAVVEEEMGLAVEYTAVVREETRDQEAVVEVGLQPWTTEAIPNAEANVAKMILIMVSTL